MPLMYAHIILQNQIKTLNLHKINKRERIIVIRYADFDLHSKE